MPAGVRRAGMLQAGGDGRGQFFQQQLGIFPAQARVGDRLTVGERLVGNDFLRSFTQETFRHDPGNGR